MQREKAETIKKIARVVAYQTSPIHLIEDVISVATIVGVNLLKRKEVSDGYLYVSMKRAAIKFINREKREETLKVDLTEGYNSRTLDRLSIVEELSAVYRATNGFNNNQLRFFYHFVTAVDEGVSGPVSYAAKICGFSRSYGVQILKKVKMRLNDESKLREVRNLQDMRQLLYRRSGKQKA